jgi:formylmethanofuran dehydrogenase subunit D
MARRFIMNAGRTTKQGQQINIGKDSAEYVALVSTLIMHPDDMREAGIVSGGTVRVRSETGEGVFHCKEGKVPSGMSSHGPGHGRNRDADIERLGG